MISEKYIIACIHKWNIEIFNQYFDQDDRFILVTTKEELSYEKVKAINPRYVFFPHWSWIVPRAIVEEYECVCFHMADVPYGRGGSPLQNLILKGHRQTKLTALKMTNVLDAGPVYLKEDLVLDGSAGEIYIKASVLSFDLIKKIIATNPTPVEQEGEIVEFKRRAPAQSEISKDLNSLEDLYDFIRMLDADGYPHAFIRIGQMRFEFRKANFQATDKALSTECIVKIENVGEV
jgi:methionyl-tRNA formyltransferase